MNSPNFDSSGDNESWDGKGELEWTEKSWKQFLRDADSEVGRFIKIYQSLKDDTQRLDHTALAMGWDAEEWSTDLELTDERSEWSEQFSDEDEFDDMDDDDPYTIHKHPLYVTSRALYGFLNFHWKIIVSDYSNVVNLNDACEFSDSVRNGETNAIMGIHALEMGDYNLVVCHLQRAMEALNQSLGVFQRVLSKENVEVEEEIAGEFQIGFFDLREVWLRVIRECRGTSDFR
ncbi:MAG: hypothetical protein MI748_21705 [Opitutales bacterium]|nr:hypothetical protein [Opitutales bacterium]